MKVSMLLSLLVLGVSGSAYAGETAWQEVMPEVSMRLISADSLQSDGVSWIGLEIDMPQSFKTYWRVPGESGIPPQLDFTGSEGIDGQAMAWPFPTRTETEAYLDHAYYGRTVLPIAVDMTGETAKIALNAMLGICSDICVPVNAEFSLGVDTQKADRGNGLRIDQARAMVPIPWDGHEMIGDVSFDVESGVLTAEVIDEWFPAETAIADIAGRMMLFGVPDYEREARLLHFPLLGRVQTPLSQEDMVHISFDTPDGPYEIVRPLDGQGAE